MPKKIVSLLAFALLSFPLVMTELAFGVAPPSTTTQSNATIPYTRFTLPNGLTVVVSEDHKAPVVAVGVWYHTGAADEPAGKAGFAHLYEHLMFSGSENHKGSYFAPFERAGATDQNGATSFDVTRYYETVPTTALDMALWMESDRMGHLLGAIGQHELDTQRGVVENEKRQGENEPGGHVLEDVLNHIWPANHAYQHGVIGSVPNLDAASLADVKQWFRQYYGAANATLVLVGDITEAQARAKAAQYFGDIPAGPPVPRQQPWVTPLAQTLYGVQYDQVANPSVSRTWVAPQVGADDSVLLQLAAMILGGEKTSRLYQRIVYQDKLADSVGANSTPYALAGTFTISVDSVHPGKLRALDAAIDNEVKRFVDAGPTPDELERAKLAVRLAILKSLENVGGNSGKLRILADGQVLRNDPLAYAKGAAIAEAATPASVKAAAARWLSKGSYVLTVLPANTKPERGEQFAKIPPRGAAEGHPAPQIPPARAYVTEKSQVDRSKGVPPVTTFPGLKFPALEHARLSNGIEVVLAQWHAIPVTHVQLLFDAGFAADQGRKLGTANATAIVMNESTHDLDAMAVDRLKQQLGAVTNVSCGLDACWASLDALNDRLQPSLALFADIVRNPAFKAEDVKRQLNASDIEAEKSDPNALALRTLPVQLYGKQHAYGIPFTGSGTEASVESIQPSDLKAFHRDWMRPDNVKILVAGDTTLKQIVPQLEAVFGDWKAPHSPVPKKNIAPVTPQTRARVFLIDRPGAGQSMILAGLLAPSSKSAQALQLELANDAFGGTFMSRLNMNLRENKRWSYGANSDLVDAVGQRPLFITAPVQTDKTADAMREIVKELSDVAGPRPLTAQEIENVKASTVRSMPGQFQTGSDVLDAMQSIAQYDRPADYVNQLKAQVEGVTPAQAQSALAEVVRAQGVTWVIVGDLKTIEKPVRALNLGDVKVLDADGNVMPSR